MPARLTLQPCDPEHLVAPVALVAYAFGSGRVGIVRAHTLPEANASTHVLVKCGFHCMGTVVDPVDGPVWRWERGV